MSNVNIEWAHLWWDIFHTTCLLYKHSSKSEAKFNMFLNWFIDGISCKVCLDEFTKLLRNNPMNKYSKSNRTMFLWSYIIHDSVNRRLGKKSPPFDNIIKMYFNRFKSICDECN